MRVLVVDDVEELRCLLKVILEAEAPISVIEAASGEEALEVVARETVDVVVMDHSMPGMSGLAAARALRECAPEVEVVAFTSMPDAEASFLAVGAVRHFTKPDVDPLIEFLCERSVDGRYRAEV